MAPPLDVQLLLQRHGGALRELARELLRDGADVDDAVQETWARALRSPPRHQERIGGWLAAILRNVAFRLRRSESRRVRHEERAAARATIAEEDHANRIARAELAHRLIAAVDALDAAYRDTIWQRFFEGRPPRDIASVSGVPLATVKSRLQRGLATLRERLGEREGSDWRTGFAAAFGVGKEGTIAAATLAGGVLMATWTKVTVAGAATAAIMLVMLWPADAPAPGVAPQRGAQAAVAMAVTSQRDASQQDAQRPERDAVAAAPQLQPASPVAAVQAGSPGAVRGRAVDAVTKEPLAGVRAKLASGKVDVDAPDPEVQTGADGAFEFAVRAGSTPLVTLARDDRVETRWGFLRIPSGHTEQVGDVALRRGRFVRGRVVA
ncbi:MAG TPA: sigma-70 family RNA polymerase sigma factor, partial [Planctomycetota bacterium]|nr:sigma-70 family RNA polymerase sigma factor [Planctomycetota bacterium]